MMRSIVNVLFLLIGGEVCRAEILEVGSLQIDLDRWWGPDNTTEIDTSVRKATINFTEEMITDLRSRIRNRRKPYAVSVEGRTFEDGFNTNQLDKWMDFWSEEYAFNEQEAYLNEPPQYVVNVGGLDVHFIWIKAQNTTGKRVIPVLMVHGFPGSIREFFEVIPKLTAENSTTFALDLVIPCLPGFGFSQPAVKPGLGSVEIAVLLDKVMQALEYDQYFVHGGDWGSIIASHLATLFQKKVLGYHTNFAISLTLTTFITWGLGSYNPDLVVDSAVQDRMYPISNITSFLLKGGGYLIFQATKPESLCIGLADSPTGLLAYILQLISTGTRGANDYTEDGGLETYFTKNQLIDNLMFYWATNSVTTAARLYVESFRSNSTTSTMNSIATSVPTWTLHAKNEIIYMSHALLKNKYTNIKNSTILEDGGHFLALEKPDVLAADLLKAIREYLALENASS